MGCDPLEVMLHEIKELLTEARQHDDVEIKRSLRGQAVEVASKLAPYLHPKLAMVALEGLLDHRHTHTHVHASLDKITAQLTDQEIDVLESVYQRLTDEQSDVPPTAAPPDVVDRGRGDPVDTS